MDPLVYSDFPDPDIIRVGDTYYLASTTMHFMPGGAFLRSKNLLDWEFVGHIFDRLDETPAQRLVAGEGNIYGQGMWAPSLRYHEGFFYVVFASNDTRRTYLYRAERPEGPWTTSTITGFYHDSSLFFDDDGKAYLVHGNRTLALVELNDDLTGPREGGLERVIARDSSNGLGYEGSHLYKRDGRYYVFAINWPRDGTNRRLEHCFIADSLTGDFVDRTILDDDYGFFNRGVAQGGMVDTPEGDYYLFMFQDRGALGRVPVLLPMEFDAEGHLHVLDPDEDKLTSQISQHPQRWALNGSDDFRYEEGESLAPFWEFNHQPDPEFYSFTQRPGAFRLTTKTVCTNLTQAINTLTQRAVGPVSSAAVTVDAAGMKIGDYAGLVALQGCYSAAAVIRESDGFYLVVIGRPDDYEVVMGHVADNEPPVECVRIPLNSPIVRLKVAGDFTDLKDKAAFYYWDDKGFDGRYGEAEFPGNDFLNAGRWLPIGGQHKLFFHLDHFSGCRYGLFHYATQTAGGTADFLGFTFERG